MIPLIKPWIGIEEAEAVAEAIASGWIAQGPRVEEFERALATRVGAVEGVAVSSCTTGLHLALYVLDVGPGDDVIVPSLSFIATANAPRYVGARPVFADVDPVTFNMTVETIEAALTPTTRAVILVHQLGMPADINSVREFCDRHSLALIEDAACAIGSTYQGSPIGGNSDLVVFSFHPRKLLTTGEGGMVMTSDHDLAARMRRLRQHGMSQDAYSRHGSGALSTFDELGFNFRLTDIQAAMGMVQLDRLGTLIERRRSQADRYAQALEDVEEIRVPGDPAYGTTNYQSYAIVLASDAKNDRDELMKYLAANGISTRVGVMAAHREGALQQFAAAPLPATESLTDTSLILPLFHDLKEDDQERVALAIQRHLGGKHVGLS